MSRRCPWLCRGWAPSDQAASGAFSEGGQEAGRAAVGGPSVTTLGPLRNGSGHEDPGGDSGSPQRDNAASIKFLGHGGPRLRRPSRPLALQPPPTAPASPRTHRAHRRTLQVSSALDPSDWVSLGRQANGTRSAQAQPARRPQSSRAPSSRPRLDEVRHPLERSLSGGAWQWKVHVSAQNTEGKSGGKTRCLKQKERERENTPLYPPLSSRFTHFIYFIL